MRSLRLVLVMMALLLLQAALPSAATFAQAKAEFKLGFRLMADLIPDIVGQPIEDEHYGANGDSLQQTTTGLMVWRKADNWTAFTNGSRTWVNGPFGVMERGNDERFEWEHEKAATREVASPVTVPPPPTPTLAPTPAIGSAEPRQITAETTRPVSPETSIIDRRVLLLIYDPILRSGQRLTAYAGWRSPDVLTGQAIDFFKRVSYGRLNYSVAQRVEINNEWLVKVDGFSYSEDAYLSVIGGKAPQHEPDIADYHRLLNNQALDICGKANRGEIDEVWLWGGPWFGFYESRLVGPKAFAYNSPPITANVSCDRLLPIMGFSYERGLNEVVHDFGHRTEATMTQVYGSWQQNRMGHNWDRFGLTRAQSPSFSAFGLGSVHFPPNARSNADAYRYDLTASVPSYSDDFYNYPNLSGEPERVAKDIGCQAWGCTELGYYEWWFRHLPRSTGIGPDGKLNDWWQYLASPGRALSGRQVLAAELKGNSEPATPA